MLQTNEKMYAVLRDKGETVEINTDFLMNNQYPKLGFSFLIIYITYKKYKRILKKTN